MRENDIIIADAGSTKTAWALIPAESEDVSVFNTQGINALLTPAEDTSRILREAFGLMAPLRKVSSSATVIYFYGAGCATPALCDGIKSCIKDVFHTENIEVGSDLLGAARSLLGHRPGIACILGTGSNSCLYDGHGISRQVPSLGFILGDEGSGASLGKCLVSGIFKKQLPENIIGKFLKSTGLTLPEILDNVYKKTEPNRYLASFVPFLSANLWSPDIYSLVLAELTRFIRMNVVQYSGSQSLPVSFTGSIAMVFERLLREAAASQGLSVSKISQSPLEGLVEYHKGECV